MPLVNGFVNISLAYHLFGMIPAVPDEERRGLLGRLPVVVCDYVGVGLEEPNVRVADSLAETLRADTGFQRAGRKRVAQIMLMPTSA
jgi:hypothetical protein